MNYFSFCQSFQAPTEETTNTASKIAVPSIQATCVISKRFGTYRSLFSIVCEPHLNSNGDDGADDKNFEHEIVHCRAEERAEGSQLVRFFHVRSEYRVT